MTPRSDAQRPAEVVFCERCGGRLGTGGRASTATKCETCGCFVCSSCAEGPAACRTCAEAAAATVAPATVAPATVAPAIVIPPTAAPASAVIQATDRVPAAARGRRAQLSAVAVLGVVLVGLAFVLASSPSSAPATGGVAGATGVPTPAAGGANGGASVGAGGGGGASSVASPASSPVAGGQGQAQPSPAAPPAPSGAATEIAAATVRSWPSPAGGTSLEIVVAVRNTGSAAIAVDPAASSYVVADRSGAGVATGRFAAALPGTIRPGETAYLVATDSTALVRGSQALTVRPEVAADAAPPTTSRLRVDPGSPTYGGDIVKLVAKVTNESATTASNVVVGAVLLDRRGRPLAALYGLAGIGPLRARETASATLTYPPAGPLDPKAVARVVAWAFELE